MEDNCVICGLVGYCFPCLCWNRGRIRRKYALKVIFDVTNQMEQLSLLSLRFCNEAMMLSASSVCMFFFCCVSALFLPAFDLFLLLLCTNAFVAFF